VKYADACEIACGSEIRLRRVKERILFHILRSKIFHNARERIISHSASPNISLKRKLHFCTMTKREHVGSTYVLPFHVGNGFATELEGIGIGVLNKNSSRFCIGSTNGIAPH
jgi:hypothetical protein